MKLTTYGSFDTKNQFILKRSLIALCAGVLLSAGMPVRAQAAKAVPLKGQAAIVLSEGEHLISDVESPGVYVVDETGGTHRTDVDAVIEEAETAAAADASAQQAEKAAGGQRVADYAMQFVGNPYRYGGTSLTSGADCSGFVQSVYRNFGIYLPRTSAEQARSGVNIGTDLAKAQPGDLICYSGHIGIYIGGGKIVNASSARTGIKVSNACYRPVKSIRRVI